MIRELFLKVGGKIVMGLGIIAGLFLLFRQGRKQGELETQNKATKEAAQNEVERVTTEATKTVEKVKASADVHNDVSRASDSVVNERLRNDWSD